MVWSVLQWSNMTATSAAKMTCHGDTEILDRVLFLSDHTVPLPDLRLSWRARPYPCTLGTAAICWGGHLGCVFQLHVGTLAQPGLRFQDPGQVRRRFASRDSAPPQLDGLA